MSTLEERILCQNVPGRYSEWQGEKDDIRHEDDDKHSKNHEENDSCASDHDDEMDEMRLHQQMAESGIPDPLRQTMYGQQTGARTGVKGVLKDYKEAKKVEKIEKELEKQHREYILKQLVNGNTITTSSSTQIQKTKETLSDESEGSDDEFLKNYREQRLNQMKSMASRPTFGQVKEVDAFEFLEEVDSEDPRTFVVVHLYEPYIKQCSMMNNYLETLAQKYQFVKFLRLLSSVASESYDHIALPTIMIYRNRQQIHTLVRIQDDLGENFNIKDVEWLLESCDVFASINNNQNTNQNSNNITNYSVLYDDLIGDEEFSS